MKKVVLMLLMTVLMTTSVMAHGDHERPACPVGSYAAGNDPVAYANAVVVTSGSVSHAANAVGVKDNHYAYISSTDPDSYIVLDMGAGEEIWDKFGLDFKLFQDNSKEYWGDVYVSNSPTSGWQWVGFTDGKGNDEFTIGFTGYDHVRYVKIVNHANKRMEIDAVKGYCITQPTGDPQDVPEFGVLAALGVLGLAGLFIYKKRQ